MRVSCQHSITKGKKEEKCKLKKKKNLVQIEIPEKWTMTKFAACLYRTNPNLPMLAQQRLSHHITGYMVTLLFFFNDYIIII